jgi:hypothetical protein
MDWAIAGPSNTGSPDCPPAIANDRISDVILGSKETLTDNAADPSAASEPSIRAAQDKNRQKQRPQKRDNKPNLQEKTFTTKKHIPF